MRPVVRALWVEFTEPLEGGVACLYNDIRGKTTIAYGNLCDTPGEAAALPLFHVDGRVATVAEKLALWSEVHNDPLCATLGWPYAAKKEPRLRLTPDGMAGLALSKLESNDRILAARFAPGWEALGACVQMALHSLAWAAGPYASFTKLYECVRRGVFAVYTPTIEDGVVVQKLTGGAAKEIKMNEWTPEGKRNVGLIPRNERNQRLMVNAQKIADYKLDPDIVEWTRELDTSNDVTPPTSTASYPTIHPDPSDYFLATTKPEEDTEC